MVSYKENVRPHMKKAVRDHKNDILNAWILIEQLAEGTLETEELTPFLKRNMNALKNTLVTKMEAVAQTISSRWSKKREQLEAKIATLDESEKHQALRKKLEIAIERLKRKPPVGVTIFIGRYPFSEVISVLRQQYNFKATHEEVSGYHTPKFGMAFNLNYDLKMVDESAVFLPVSTYIRQHKILPDSPETVATAESDLGKRLSTLFESNFDYAIRRIIKDWHLEDQTIYFKINDHVMSDSNLSLHSFFIADLEVAKRYSYRNLMAYLYGTQQERVNLDSHKNSKRFAGETLRKLLEPKRYPCGRYPMETKFSLSLMQQVAVNIIRSNNEPLVSVNGPPGTGKTTLLKDVFADFVVAQAYKMSTMKKRRITECIGDRDSRIEVLPQTITDKGILVASSNNGAIQNIMLELPKVANISESFRESLLQCDYFRDISNGIMPSVNERKIANSDEVDVSKDLDDENILETSVIKNDGLSEADFATLVDGDIDTIEPMSLFPEHYSKNDLESNWGLFAIEGGTASKLKLLLEKVQGVAYYLEHDYMPNPKVYNTFLATYKAVKDWQNQQQAYYERMYELERVKAAYEQAKINYPRDNEVREAKWQALQASAQQAVKDTSALKEQYAVRTNEVRARLVNIHSQIDILQGEWQEQFLANPLADLTELDTKLQAVIAERDQLEAELQSAITASKSLFTKQASLAKEVSKEWTQWQEWQQFRKRELETLKTKYEELKVSKGFAQDDLFPIMEGLNFSTSYEALQMSNPWFDEAFRQKQTELFILALQVRKQFLYENREAVAMAAAIWLERNAYKSTDRVNILAAAWEWLNLVIPVVSTTFASLGRMFDVAKARMIGNLFIDEAGQALPYACIGGLIRSKRVIAVGDPMQIEPVMTLDSMVLGLIANTYGVSAEYISSTASVQTIIDEASPFGYYKDSTTWIGIPLWVHRRCNEPMFSIANEIAYNGKMVQGKLNANAHIQAQWYHVPGKAVQKYVAEQGEFLVQCIKERLAENPSLKDSIYVISPFKNVARCLAALLKQIKFTQYSETDKNRPTNVGTVHTFQGKEADIVYLVLGADQASVGAARWAVSKPNILNVAATRAKKEFYVIGDKTLYSQLQSHIMNRTIDILDKAESSDNLDKS